MNNQALATQTERRLPAPAPGSLRALLQSTEIQRKFEQVLGKRAPQFIASLSAMAYASRQLSECEPMTIVTAALQAAAFDLPINPDLGLAHIIPYGKQARFQPGWRAYVQLAHRTNQYRSLHVTEVYAGEVRGMNRMTGMPIFGQQTGGEIIGYLAHFQLVNGFEKYVYMTVEEIDAHAKKYSKTYSRNDSAWKTHFDAMARKTVIKSLLSKWGPLSIDLQKAIAADTPPDDEPALGGNGNGHGTEADKAALFGTDLDAEAPASEAPPETAAPDPGVQQPPMPEPPPPSDEEMAAAVAQFDQEQAQAETGRKRRR